MSGSVRYIRLYITYSIKLYFYFLFVQDLLLRCYVYYKCYIFINN